jgi:hypothetical protein
LSSHIHTPVIRYAGLDGLDRFARLDRSVRFGRLDGLDRLIR